MGAHGAIWRASCCENCKRRGRPRACGFQEVTARCRSHECISSSRADSYLPLHAEQVYVLGCLSSGTPVRKMDRICRMRWEEDVLDLHFMNMQMHRQRFYVLENIAAPLTAAGYAPVLAHRGDHHQRCFLGLFVHTAASRHVVVSAARCSWTDGTHDAVEGCGAG